MKKRNQSSSSPRNSQNRNSQKPFWKDRGEEKKGPKSPRKGGSSSYTADKRRKEAPRGKDKSEKKKSMDMHEPMRINRFIALSGVCARREAEQYILAGEIKINGKVSTELGTKVIPAKDTVSFRGTTLTIQQFVYVLINKPKNMITTVNDPQGRKTVMDLIRNHVTERIYPVGRLDRNTTGLLLLTNDGQLSKKMTHPSHKVPKIYHARLDKDFEEEDMQRLLDGIMLDDGIAQVDKIDYVMDKGKNEVGLELHIGRNRIVRRMFESMGYKVMALDRVSIGHLTKKNLPRGKWRTLTPKEINFLRMM